MNKKLLFSALAILFIGCFANYPMTTFWVANQTDKTINFKSTVLKHSTSTGPYEMTLPFMVRPKDSVLVRYIGFRTGGNPGRVFIDLTFFPVGGIVFKNFADSTSWKKAIDANGMPKYTYYIQNPTP
jgi:hypothetical protein